MKKTKVLIYGNLEQLMRFFAKRFVQSHEIIAVMGEEGLENFSFMRDGKRLDVFTPQNLPATIYELADGIIFLNGDPKEGAVKFFIERGIDLKKIMILDDKFNWKSFELKDATGTRTIYLCGLEFHIRTKDDERFQRQIETYLKRQNHRRTLDYKEYPRLVSKIWNEHSATPLDLSNCKTFTEKLQWLKIYNAIALKSLLADKYLMRSWVAEKIGEQYLIPLLGVWDDFDDIDFNNLPAQFVLKCNHGSSMNIIVRDKKTFKSQQTRERLNAWLAVDFAAVDFEIHYTRIDRKIIAEKFMANGNASDLVEYNFWCFGGKPHCCRMTTGQGVDLKADYFSLNWIHLNYEEKTYPNSKNPKEILPPKNFELMKELAAKLAAGFPFVSVNFYEINGRVYLCGMNFIPESGNFSYKSEGTDEYLGKLLRLPPPKPMQLKVPLRSEYRIRQNFRHEIKLPPPPATVPERNVIASLTSWKKRVGAVHLAIQTLLKQTHLPD